MRQRALGLALLVACLGASPAALAIQDEIQVYTDDLDLKGESGVEIHLNTTPKGRSTPNHEGDVPPQGGVRFTPEFSWGLGHGFDWGLYLPSTTDADWNYHFGGAKLRVKWLPLRAAEGESGWYAGINNELSNLNKAFSDSRWNDEVRIMGGYRGRNWLVGFNPILEWSLSPGFRGSPDITLAFKAVHEVFFPGFALGAEYYQDMGPLSNPLPRDEQARTLYAIAEVERKSWSLNFGVGRGLTPATDDWTVKAIIGISFD